MWPNKFTWKGCQYQRYFYMNKTQQWVSFDLIVKSNARFITSFFCNGKYYDVAYLSSCLKDWIREGGSIKGNSSHLYPNTSQQKRKKFMINDCFKTDLIFFNFLRKMAFNWWHDSVCLYNLSRPYHHLLVLRHYCVIS